MAENHLNSLMDVTLDKLRAVADADTVVGTPVTAGGYTLVPISKVTLGLASGGSDWQSKADAPVFGGGSGAGVSVTPVAVLVIGESGVRSIPVSAQTTAVDRAIASIPELVDLFRSDKHPVE